MRVVAAAVIIEDGRLFLARRPPSDNLAGLWELPGGKVEEGETPQECLVRELREELAMEAEVGVVLAETECEYAHGSFRVVALRTTRLSDYTLLAHDQAAWLRCAEISECALAPADAELVCQLMGRGHWPA